MIKFAKTGDATKISFSQICKKISSTHSIGRETLQNGFKIWAETGIFEKTDGIRFREQTAEADFEALELIREHEELIFEIISNNLYWDKCGFDIPRLQKEISHANET